MGAFRASLFWAKHQKTIRNCRNLLFQWAVAYFAWSRQGLHQFNARPFDRDPLRQSFRRKCASVPHNGDVRPESTIFGRHPEVLHKAVQILNQGLQLGWHGGTDHAGYLWPWPELQTVKTQSEWFYDDFAGARLQVWQLPLRKLTNVSKRDMPVAAIDRPAFNRFGDRVNDVTKTIALAIIRPKREKESASLHSYAIRSLTPCRAWTTVCSRT